MDIEFDEAVRNDGADKDRVTMVVIGGRYEHSICYLASMVWRALLGCGRRNWINLNLRKAFSPSLYYALPLLFPKPHAE